MNDLERQRRGLVAVLQRQGIRNERVLAAIGRVPRERFVPPELVDEAYADRALPIGQGQTISQPFVVARMTELLEPEPTHRVLEIGTGSGYQAAVLSQLVREVVSVERLSALAERSRIVLGDLGAANVTVVVGDGTLGYAPLAPYDGIIVTAAAPKVPGPLVEQVAVGGRIVAPLGPRDFQDLTVLMKTDHGLERRPIEAVKFVPLVGEHGYREDDEGWR